MRIKGRRSHIVQIYNKYTGSIDKLGMICCFYKPNLKDHTWYIYICPHTLLIAHVKRMVFYRRNFKILQPTKKFMPLKKFQAKIVASLVITENRKAGRPSIDTAPAPSKKVAVKGTPTNDTRM